ncbi:glycosyltransferase family protein [Reyranella sp.]|uniref:glycosyltransferase family protein n=1 Tax=Reyranella sp. TaxID=1929291 RepID=UPI003BACD51E
MKPRIFFHVQHLLGIGHLRRAATLARCLAAGGFDVLLVSGGAPVDGLALGEARLHQLPPVRAADDGLRDLVRLDGGPVDAGFERDRAGRLLALLRAEQPDIVLTEQFPFGRTRLHFELAPLLEAARELPRRPLVACSVRDIVRRTVRAERVAETVRLIERHYDAVLIHADPTLVPFEASFAGWPHIKERAHYTGYVAEQDVTGPPESDAGCDEVIVSAGGGAVGAGLLEAAIAARPATALTDRRWRLLLGANLPDACRARLAAATGAAMGGIVAEPARSDFTTLLRNAALSISQAGYNTTIETLCCADRAVLVPFATARETEQADRAGLLAARGMVATVEPGTLSPRSLADAVAHALAGPSLRSFPACDAGGAEATVGLLHRLSRR